MMKSVKMTEILIKTKMKKMKTITVVKNLMRTMVSFLVNPTQKVRKEKPFMPRIHSGKRAKTVKLRSPNVHNLNLLTKTRPSKRKNRSTKLRQSSDLI